MDTMTKKFQTQYHKLFIGGEWVEPSSNAKVTVVSPHDQSVVGYTVLAAKEDVDKAVSIARKTFDTGICYKRKRFKHYLYHTFTASTGRTNQCLPPGC